MKKLLYVLSTFLAFSFMVISWIASFNLLIEANIMSIFNFLFFLMPASFIITILLFYLFYQDRKLFVKDEIPSSKSVISVSATLLALSIILFVYPFLPGPNKIVEKYKPMLETLSIESALNTNLVDKETQYKTSLYEKKRLGKITYISSEYMINTDKIWLRPYDSKEKIVACESSLKYIENVPDLIYDVERSIFKSLTNMLKHENDTSEEDTVNGANSQFKYSIYFCNLALTQHNESEMKEIIIFAENGEDLLLYRLAVCDDYDNLEIDKEYILELVQSCFEHED